MAEALSDVERMVAAIVPHDSIGRRHRFDTLAWLRSTDDLYRRVKPATPSPHLVSYFLLVDRASRSVLLCDHRLAGLWLPTGGHVEAGENPAATVLREAAEELGVEAEFDRQTGDRPFFVTMTETVGSPESRHIDVSLWFALAGRVGQALQPDPRELREVRWWTTDELGEAAAANFEPHLERALVALDLIPHHDKP